MNLIRMKQLCEILQLSRPTIYKYVKLGMPIHYVGKTAYFDTLEIENWIKNIDRKGK